MRVYYHQLNVVIVYFVLSTKISELTRRLHEVHVSSRRVHFPSRLNVMLDLYQTISCISFETPLFINFQNHNIKRKIFECWWCFNLVHVTSYLTENGFIMKLDVENTNGAIRMSKSDKNNKGNDLGYRAKWEQYISYAWAFLCCQIDMES